jgi:hypothetical protein
MKDQDLVLNLGSLIAPSTLVAFGPLENRWTANQLSLAPNHLGFPVPGRVCPHLEIDQGCNMLPQDCPDAAVVTRQGDWDNRPLQFLFHRDPAFMILLTQCSDGKILRQKMNRPPFQPSSMLLGQLKDQTLQTIKGLMYIPVTFLDTLARHSGAIGMLPRRRVAKAARVNLQ